MKLIECVPNFSEGRNIAAIDAIRDQIAAVPGVSILHVTSDASHNRSVITFVAPSETMADAAVAAIRAARDHIDLTRHAGVHPRIGAADVVPFIPLDGATMDDCIAIAREVGRRVGDDLGIPVYLYERAATRDTRRNLADVRRGGFEGIRDAIVTDPERAPDFGPSRVHPTAGAVAIGARPFLIAFNTYIGGSNNMRAARDIARAIRQSNGGLPAVKALGLEVDGQAQVSMNLVDIDQTSLAAAYAAVDREARERGLEIVWSEVIGLVPERAAFEVSSQALKLRDDIGAHVLERALLAQRAEQSVSAYIASVASADAVPGGGSVAAIAGALAAGLVAMVAGLTVGRARYAAVESDMRAIQTEALEIARELQALAIRDAESYERVADAHRLPHQTPEETTVRDRAIRDSLLGAIIAPLAVARCAARTIVLVDSVAERGNPNAISDAGVAALLASAACTGACYNVRINARSLRDPLDAQDAVKEAIALAAEVETLAASIGTKVSAAI